MVEEPILTCGSRHVSQPEGPIQQFEALATRLRAGGWYARVLPTQHGSALRVVNPDAVPLNDDIILWQDAAGVWWFLWSFGAPVAPAGDLDAAAHRIAYVLGGTVR
jgi:hypothetical protein